MTGRAALVVVAAAAILGPGAPASAQDGEPLVVSPQTRWELIRFEDVDLSLELEYRRNVDSRTPAGGSRERDVEDRLREILEVSTGGYLGHPNLVQLDLGARFRLEQAWLDLDTSGSKQRVSNNVIDWNVSGLILQQSNFPLTLYTRQNTSDVDQQFGGTFQNTYQESGARASLRSDVAPTNINLFYRNIYQQDTLGGTDFNIDQYSAWADGRVEFGQAQRMSWNFKYDDVNESGELRTPQTFERLEINALHTYQFGNAGQHSIRSRGRFVDETGDRDFRQILLEERLRLQHSDTLQSWYDYRFESVDRFAQSQLLNRGSANFSHQVFDSLTTIGQLGFNLLDVTTDNFTSNELFANINSDYTKEVPAGRLEIGVDALYSYVDQSERGSPLAVTDELFIFGPTNMFTINQRNVIASSIRITDLTGIVLYTEGVDYSVLTLTDRTEVTRLPGGAIAPGQSVLVDYVIGPEPGGVIDTFGIGGSLRYTFEDTFLRGLSVYGSLFRQDQSRSGPMLDEFPDEDFTDLIYGVEYDQWKVYLRAERQQRDSSLSSFDATRLEGRYTERLGRGSALVFSALYQDLDRTDENQRTITTTFSGQWNQQLTDRLRFGLLVQYQLTDDRNGPDSEAFEQEFDLNWRFRQTMFYAQIRNSFSNTDVDDTGFQRFVVGVRREF